MKISELYIFLKEHEKMLIKYPQVRTFVATYEGAKLNDHYNTKTRTVLKTIARDLAKNIPPEIEMAVKEIGGKTALEFVEDDQEAKKNNHKPPTMVAQIKGLTADVVKYAKNGFKNCTEEQYFERLRICRGCEFYDKNGFNGLGRCLKCGCSGVKLKMGTSRCPVGKWEAVS